MMSSKNLNLIYYGTKVNTLELQQFVKHIIETNQNLEENNLRKNAICIWGEHGIGKTQTIEKFAYDNGFKFAYIAPAQFEEMGDLLGMPQIQNENNKKATAFVPPDWVPKEEGPGILLIDDANRADDRILRGIMQLLQNYELVSWKLPKKWHIILTANPDGGDYSVTPMDFAMLTRMLHITLTFDVKAWAKWAENNNIDSRGINFVLSYPEIITGERTTPRTLVQFLDNIKRITDLKKDLPLVKMLADACLDNNTVAAFISFINQDLNKLVSPEDILNVKDKKDFDTNIYEKIKKIVDKETKRLDILSVICTRLSNYVTVKNHKLKKNELDNLKSFLLMDFMPNDMRLIMAQEFSSHQNTKDIMSDVNIGKLLLGKM
ncbi:MAG: ATPase [Bacteroidetes bacterium]|nr:MAG: ATPase [Bacteroidota bacterium]TAG88151.1 MAG: ATPase [Bacteroidota bacterium]